MLRERIASDTALGELFIELVARTANHRYKAYTIPKKTGGERQIYHPARELKLMQVWLDRNIFSRLPTHEAATAYKRGSKIHTNASQHVAQNYLLRIDFQDFFPSITGEDVAVLLRANVNALAPLELTAEDIELTRLLVCRNDHLTIGAPSSPAISNAVMFEFDGYWSDHCRRLEVHYTRYADDLYFSTDQPKVLERIIADLRADLPARRSPRLVINDQKTVFTSRKRRRLVTGLVLTADKKLSIGRRQKRYIRGLLFQRTRTGGPNKVNDAYLRGYLAFARSVEPEFIESLVRKYGDAVADLI